MRKIFAFLLAGIAAASVSMAMAADTCAPCGLVCGRSAMNCMIESSSGAPLYCEWSNGSTSEQKDGVVVLIIYPCE